MYIIIPGHIRVCKLFLIPEWLRTHYVSVDVYTCTCVHVHVGEIHVITTIHVHVHVCSLVMELDLSH